MRLSWPPLHDPLPRAAGEGQGEGPRPSSPAAPKPPLRGRPNPGLARLFCLALGFLCLAPPITFPATARADAPSDDQGATPTAAVPRQALISQADRAFHAGRYAEAADLYRRAALLDRQAGDAPLMAAVAAFQIHQYGQARRDLGRALSRRLSREDQELGLLYLDLLAESSATPATDSAHDDSGPSGSETFAPSLSTTFGAGLERNPTRAGAAALEGDLQPSSGRATGVGSASLELGLAGTPLPGLDLDVDYTVEQSAYQDRALADLDYQDHLLELRLQTALSAGVQLATTVAGELSFSGTGRAMRPFSRALRSGLELTLGEGALKLRLAGGYQATAVQDRALTFLGGHRFELRATPMVQLGGWRASLAGRLRVDALGSARSTAITEDELSPCPGCRTGTVVPYASQSAALSTTIMAPLPWRLRPALWARVERRTYTGQALLELGTPAGTSRIPLGHRLAGSAALGASLRLRITSAVALTARWDHASLLTVFRPRSPGACSGHDFCGNGTLADRRHDKQTFALDLQIDWM